MLDVECANDADAGIKQLQHILVALLVATAGGVCVRQFIDYHDSGPALEYGVQVHVFDHDFTVFHAAPGDRLQTFYERSRLRSAMRLDVSKDHIDATLAHRLGFFKHSVGLAHSGCKSDVEL